MVTKEKPNHKNIEDILIPFHKFEYTGYNNEYVLQVIRHDGRHRTLVASKICPRSNIPVFIIPEDEDVLELTDIEEIRQGLYEEYAYPGEEIMWIDGPLFNTAYEGIVIKW